MKTPLVTIITVTYNSSEFVREAIDSILASTYTNFELIIGDDNSIDNTWEIINEYTDKRIIKYQNETNIGEYPNRNKAISMAKGEYLLFIDGDDMIYPHGLKFMTEMLHSFPDCGMALMYPYLNWAFFPIVLSSRQYILGHFFGYGFNNLAFTNTFFRTKLLKQEIYFSNKYRSGDSYTRLKIAKDFNTLIIQDQLTWWRETPNQASKRYAKSVDWIFETYSMNNKLLSESDNLLTEIEVQDATNNLYFKLKMNFIQIFKRMDINGLLIILKYLIRNKIIFKVLKSQYTSNCLFEKYTSTNPMTNKN